MQPKPIFSINFNKFRTTIPLLKDSTKTGILRNLNVEMQKAQKAKCSFRLKMKRPIDRNGQFLQKI